MEMPRLDSFVSPTQKWALDVVSEDNGWSGAQLWLRRTSRKERQLLIEFDLPIQGAPVWAEDDSVFAIHTGTMSSGIHPLIFIGNGNGFDCATTPDAFDLFQTAIVQGLIPQGASPSHLYFWAFKVDQAKREMLFRLVGDGVIGGKAERFQPLSGSYKIDSAQTILSPDLGLAPVGTMRVRMAGEMYMGSGTGFVVSSSGLVVTCAHVIEGASCIQINGSFGTLFAHVVASSHEHDVAILCCRTLSDPNLETVSVRNSDSVCLGESVVTIGFPAPHILGFSPKHNRGEISALNGLSDDPSTFQISASVQPGNSGGPVMDQGGRVIGIVSSGLDALTFAKNTGSISQNINYAVKSCHIIEALCALKESGFAIRENQDANATASVRLERATVRIVVYGFPKDLLEATSNVANNDEEA